MRISEITDAQGQLELLRTVIDNTWKAISQQAEQELRAEAERKAKANLKPRAKRARKGANISISPPPPPTKPQAPLANQPPSPHNKPNPNALNPDNRLTSNNSQLQQPSKDTASNPKLASNFQPKPKSVTNVKPSFDVKDGHFSSNISATKIDSYGDDRHA